MQLFEAYLAPLPFRNRNATANRLSGYRSIAEL
jgi:hypothetical protein